MPGQKQVFRLSDSAGNFSEDVIGLQDEAVDQAEPLLAEVMTGGRLPGPHPTLTETRETFESDFAKLDEKHKVLVEPPKYQVSSSDALNRLTAQVRADLTKGTI